MFHPVKWLGGVACPPSTFRENVALNLERELEEVRYRELRNEPLYIACAGPSLRETADELRGKKHVWALNGAHDYLIQRGIVPSHGIAQAPEHQILWTFKNIRPDIVYAFASCTHPDLIARAIAEGAKVVLWHAHVPNEWGVEYGDRDLVFGGATIGLRSLDLAYMVGFREVHLLGFDCCLSPDLRIGPDLPIYEDRRKDIVLYESFGRFFAALPSHARQVEDYHLTVGPLKDLYLTFYGDGLMQWTQRCQSQGASNGT